MENKCSKYKTYFLFKSADELSKHVESCPDCKIEQERLDKVSLLIKEARPLYLKKKNRSKSIKIASIAAVFALCLLTPALNNNIPSYDETYISSILSADDYGFPVDSYGFILVE